MVGASPLHPHKYIVNVNDKMKSRKRASKQSRKRVSKKSRKRVSKQSRKRPSKQSRRSPKGGYRSSSSTDLATLLKYAVLGGDVKQVEQIVKLNIHPDETRWNENTLLWHAVERQNLRIVKILLENKANPDGAIHKNEIGEIRPLHLAIRNHGGEVLYDHPDNLMKIIYL